MSEKERYIKISSEFNKVKALIEANKYEEHEYARLYLKSWLGSKIEINREQIKKFLKFIKDEKR